MARVTFACTLGGNLGSGQFSTSSGAGKPISSTLSVTATEAAVATLEADGASPTQAHVTALRAAWDPLSAACTAHNNATTPDVVLDVNTAVVTTQAALRAVLRDLERRIAGSGLPP